MPTLTEDLFDDPIAGADGGYGLSDDDEWENPEAAALAAEEGDRLGDAEADAQFLLDFQKRRDTEKAQADADFARMYAEAQTLSPDYVPPPPPLTKMEEAAQVSSRLSPSELADFANELRSANERLMREARAGHDGYDLAGDPVAPPPPPLNYGSLPSNVFKAVMTAARQDGYVDPRTVPDDYGYDEFNALVQREMGR